MLESSNNGEGDWVAVTVAMVCGGDVVVLVGVEEAMDSGSNAMKEKKSLRFINGEQWKNQRWGKQKLKFYTSFLKWIHNPHSLFIHYIDRNYSRRFQSNKL